MAEFAVSPNATRLMYHSKSCFDIARNRSCFTDRCIQLVLFTVWNNCPACRPGKMSAKDQRRSVTEFRKEALTGSNCLLAISIGDRGAIYFSELQRMMETIPSDDRLRSKRINYQRRVSRRVPRRCTQVDSSASSID
mmetsp:Transcript_15484/g.24508  ORF Transcript_15484/g.24508 Transcript_15484/m.24508 type:complete len:137 (+) Transcript_15484:90-500(+)